jgi:hypothetical protein
VDDNFEFSAHVALCNGIVRLADGLLLEVLLWLLHATEEHHVLWMLPQQI